MIQDSASSGTLCAILAARHRLGVGVGTEDGSAADAVPINPSSADPVPSKSVSIESLVVYGPSETCLLYTSDAADERSSVDLGGRRILKKKKNIKKPPHVQ